MPDDNLPDEFAHQFYGYGTYAASYWFIGMEEGGGDSEATVRGCIDAWHSRGRRELEDPAGYHVTIGVTRHFSEKPALQSTWGKLIRLLLSAEGQPMTVNHVRDYQRDCWGRTNGTSCLIELLPLPSPSLGHWLYAKCSTLPCLRSREIYQQAAGQWRVEHIRRRIAERRPQAVIFYGLKYRPWWQAIAEVPFHSVDGAGLLVGRGQSTRFLIVQHPVAVGASNAYFEHAGAQLWPQSP